MSAQNVEPEQLPAAAAHNEGKTVAAWVTNGGIALGVLISGRGSNLQALIDAVGEGRLNADLSVVISNREAAGGLERARRAGIEAICVSHRGWQIGRAHV